MSTATEVKTTIHSYQGYAFTIEHDEADRAYYVDFPDLPGIITSGSTLAEAFANACEAFDLHQDSYAKDGEILPPPKHRVTIDKTGDR